MEVFVTTALLRIGLFIGFAPAWIRLDGVLTALTDGRTEM
jgi:hypothetical protein